MSAERDRIVEAATTAHRPVRSDGEIAFHPAFFDLDLQGREELFAATWRQRELERASDPAGLSATARAVLRRVRCV
jgi:hypothetical protein